MIWKILGIEPTRDKEIIRNAYHKKLHFVNPEDDQEGFKELRHAYEEALEYSDSPEESEEKTGEGTGVDTNSTNKKKTEVDLWIDRIDNIYADAALRRDVDKWNEILNDSMCDDLDVELEASEKLLVYIMSHSYLPQAVWQAIDKRFHYLDNMEQLKENFPEDFITFIKWQTEHQSFIDYDMFEGDTSSDVDKYINKLHELKGAEDEHNFKKIDSIISELEKADISHPFLQVEKAIADMLQAGELPELYIDDAVSDAEKEEGVIGNETVDSAADKMSDNKSAAKKHSARGGLENITDDDRARLRKSALEIMEDVDFEYSDNVYVHRVYGEALLANYKTDKAKAIFDELLEIDPESYSALLCRARCTIVEGDYELAKERLEDILEERVQDVETLRLLDVVNDTLVKRYAGELENGAGSDTAIKLGWCYYQQREFEKGIKLLDDLGESSDYDYVNLRCRLYLANDDYEKAYPWAKEWLYQIENSEDDGSKEIKKRKNRLSLAHFSLGVCVWEIAVKNDTVKEDEDEAVSFIQKSIEEEDNQLVKLSYMEQLARFYLAAEEYEKCVDKCTEIIKLDSGFFPAYVHRQKAYFELRHAREVIEDYYACIDIYPEFVPPYILAAEVFYAFEQYDDVGSVIEKAKEYNIDSDALELYRIRILHYREFSNDNLEKALEAARKLKKRVENRTENDPTDIEKVEDLWREYALICWDMDEDDMAIAVIDEYVSAHPDCTALMLIKSDILFQMGKGDEALEISRKIFKMSPTVYHQMRLGVSYERVDDYDNALKNYLAAYEKNSRDAGVVRRLMYLYSFLSDLRRDLDLCRLGIRYATEFIELTDSADGYIERGNLYIDLYELEKAVEDCRKAIELNPDAYYAYNNLGCALLKLRRVEEAIPPLEHAIEMDSEKDHLPFLNLAECYIVLGEYKKAIDEYKAMLDLFPKYSYIWKDIAALYCKIGDYNKAIAYYEKRINDTIKNIPADSILDKLRIGTLKNSLDKKSHNRKSGSDVLADEDKLMKLYCDIADVYRQAGDFDKAEAYYDKVLKRWKNALKPNISVKPIAIIAEYYRDKGRLDKAEKLVKAAFGKMTEEDRNSTVWKYLAFAAATIYYEIGDKLNAKNEGKIYLEQYRKWEGNFEEGFDLRYKPGNLLNVSTMYLCMGDIDKAKEYISQLPNCHLCVNCEYADCFEYYFGMGLIAEAEGKKEEAEKLYERAIEIRGDYPFAEHRLSMCRGRQQL